MSRPRIEPLEMIPPKSLAVSACAAGQSPHRNLIKISLTLSLATLFIALGFGLLPGLLALCLGYVMAQGLHGALFDARPGRLGERLSAGLVAALPFVVLALGSVWVHEALPTLQAQAVGLVFRLSETLAGWQETLSPEVVALIPGDAGVMQASLEVLRTRGPALAAIGQNGLAAVLQVVVGVLLGVLIFIDAQQQSRSLVARSPLGQAIATRAHHFGQTFRAIIAAQCVISVVNAGATALYLYLILPLFDVTLPYRGALIALTLVASLVPAAGNILCNTVLTLVSLSMGPGVAASSLVFLVLVHKSEYFISAAIVGERHHIRVWEILIAIFLGQAVFGTAGIVAGPLYYAYLKSEISALLIE